MVNKNKTINKKKIVLFFIFLIISLDKIIKAQIQTLKIISP